MPYLVLCGSCVSYHFNLQLWVHFMHCKELSTKTFSCSLFCNSCSLKIKQLQPEQVKKIRFFCLVCIIICFFYDYVQYLPALLLSCTSRCMLMLCTVISGQHFTCIGQFHIDQLELWVTILIGGSNDVEQDSNAGQKTPIYVYLYVYRSIYAQISMKIDSKRYTFLFTTSIYN